MVAERTRSSSTTGLSFDGAARLVPALLRILHHANVRQVAVALGEIQSVANNKLIGNLKPEIVDWNFFLTTLKFVEQCCQLHARRASRFQIGQQIVQRESGIDDVFNYEDVPAFDGHVEIL